MAEENVAKVEEVPSEQKPEVKIEDVTEEDAKKENAEAGHDHHDHDHHDHDHAHDHAHGEQEDGDDKGGKQNKGEKKSRKVLSKLGLKPVTGITRVAVKRSKNVLFVIQNPDVFKAAGDTYVIYGEAKIEEMGQSALQDKARQFGEQLAPGGANFEESAGGSESTPAAASGSEENVDAEGLEEKDIDLVAAQTHVTRAQAIAALKKNKGDIVNAIMELTV